MSRCRPPCGPELVHGVEAPSAREVGCRAFAIKVIFSAAPVLRSYQLVCVKRFEATRRLMSRLSLATLSQRFRLCSWSKQNDLDRTSAVRNR